MTGQKQIRISGIVNRREVEVDMLEYISATIELVKCIKILKSTKQSDLHDETNAIPRRKDNNGVRPFDWEKYARRRKQAMSNECSPDVRRRPTIAFTAATKEEGDNKGQARAAHKPDERWAENLKNPAAQKFWHSWLKSERGVKT